MIILKLLLFHFLLQTLIYQAVNFIVLHLNYCIESFYIDKNYIILQHCYKTFTLPSEKSKTISFVSSIVKNIVVFPTLSKFAGKLIF